MSNLKILLIEDNKDKVRLMRETIHNVMNCNGSIDLDSMKTSDYNYNHHKYDLILFGYNALNIIHGMSLYDDLTNLYNRKGFFYFLEQQMRVSNRYKEPFFLIFIDLNNFKEINDTYGHKTGDKVLIDFANILRNTFRNADILARTGGDEFAIFPTHTEDSMKDIKYRLNKSIKTYSQHNDYNVSLSIGFAEYDYDNPCSPDELVHQADVDMYRDKNKELKVGC